MTDLTNTGALQSEDIAETIAFIAIIPKHVNLTQVIVLPVAQVV